MACRVLVPAFFFALFAAAPLPAANNPPEVTNVTATQRKDASKLVGIAYDDPRGRNNDHGSRLALD